MASNKILYFLIFFKKNPLGFLHTHLGRQVRVVVGQPPEDAVRRRLQRRRRVVGTRGGPRGAARRRLQPQALRRVWYGTL